MRRSGILRGHDSSSGGSNGADQATSVPKPVQEAVDYAMRRLANYLLTGNEVWQAVGLWLSLTCQQCRKKTLDPDLRHAMSACPFACVY